MMSYAFVSSEVALVDDASSDERLEPGDAVLMREIALGDARALERLIARYWGPLTAYASRIVGDPQGAEDAVQTVFIRVWRDRRSAPPRSVRSFLFRVTRNLALDEVRSRGARSARESRISREAPTVQASPADLLELDALAGSIDRAIQRLPERRREAFTLAYLHDLSYAEVAEVMAVSPKTVGHHVSAALAELRELLVPIQREHTGRSS
jgi:RNA polymerase sigma-70 factor (ECF subfamily)